MEVVFSIIPGHGHFFPMLPLADALQAAGHGVRFSTSAAYADTIRRHGFDSIGVGLDYTQLSLAMSTGPADRDRVVAERMFIEGPPHVIDGLQEELTGHRPDVMLVDPYDLGGLVAAELLEGSFWRSLLRNSYHSELPGLLAARPRRTSQRAIGEGNANSTARPASPLWPR